jgi:hypothetical protein
MKLGQDVHSRPAGRRQGSVSPGAGSFFNGFIVVQRSLPQYLHKQPSPVEHVDNEGGGMAE